MEPSPPLAEAPPEADAPSVEAVAPAPEPPAPLRVGALAPRALEGAVAGLVVETFLGLLLWAAFALGKQSFAPIALLYFAGHGLLFGAALGLAAQAGERSRLLGALVGLLGAPAVFGATRFLQELIVLGNPLLAYGSLIKASGGFRWLDLSLYVLGAVACWGPVLLARWRGASGLKQAYAGLAGASAFGLGCLLSPLRFQAFSPAIYGIPLLGRVALFPLCWAGIDLWRRLRAQRRAQAERREAAGGSAPRAPRAVVDPRARHKARYLEGKAAEHLAQERWLEAGEAFTSAADLWPSAKRHLNAASAFARAEEPYRALAHLERVLDDPGHDPSWFEAPELSYLRELEAWAPLAARLASAGPARRPAPKRDSARPKAAPPALEGGEPAAEAPVAEEPAAEAPTVEESAAEAPAVEEPAGEAPAVEEPAGEAPAVEEPAAEAPAVEEPASEAPAVEEPAAEVPTVEEPASGAPAEQTVQEPVVEEPAAEAPVAEVPAGEAPAVEESATEAPVAEAPVAVSVVREAAAPPSGDPGATSPVRQTSDRVAPRRRKVARRRDAGPQELDGSQGVLIAALGLLMLLGYVFSYAWTPDASLDSVRRLWAGRLSRDGGALYGLGRDLDRGARVTLAQLKAESGSLPGALLAFGFEPASGQCGISAEWAYRSAADAGDGRAMLRLAQILSRVNPPRPQAVTDLLRRAAEAGEPRGMWLYASRLRAGTGVEADPAAARVWLERGAEAGHRDAQFLLASWLEIGHADTIPQDVPASLRWYLRAARQGHPRARGEAERVLRRYPELEVETE